MADISRDSLEYLVGLGKTAAEPIEREYEGRKYINKELKPMQPPIVSALNISTLGSLIELCSGKFKDGANDTAGFEYFDPAKHVIHIGSPTQVQVITAVSNAWKDREILINCELPDIAAFQFGKFFDQDKFIIGLLASFADTEDKGPLAKLAGNATAEQVTTMVDDGITQVISMRAGAHMQDTQAVKGLVKLAPWRTFRDVDQPSSQFLFRVQKTGDTPQFALFEADGGAWKLQAVENISRKLSAALTDATVVS